ncbi:TetR/AcrR family transcriptional regulator C-terminal domain-containing protein [Saccharopolyspora sp. K220]|uniref:TetR/AcrR family transcriptional regulator C-terminal domain-containing protein n=1 Tax=Saccharopolyspora soli TaxID=2926618 RepID=UPI001F57FB09|nr:TetR/AcrR family transcriptional regulator C-terminal domain-containing protein [Saccharopolyspora soli]MCI2416560.1 TetR/AcrR family transcriptional regulator C-terminal domain-containing protein [Saccharopolyspora soli]
MTTGPRPQPPYLRIVSDIRARIESGQLRPGDRVPSTRQIIDEWGVAMATATKALATLRQLGLVHAVPGTGTIVSDSSTGHRRPTRHRRSTSQPPVTQERIVRTAIGIADREGRAAVSMRRIAAELGVGAMSLYRHVTDKDELIRLMADTAFGEAPLPEPGRRGWRARLEEIARLQWATYRRHPWLAPVALTSLAHPPVLSSGMAHVDWQIDALGGLGLPQHDILQIVVSLNGYVGGIAMSHALEHEYVLESGITMRQRHDTDEPVLRELLRSGRFPHLATATGGDIDLDALFEFGLQRQLDGIQNYLTRRPK